MRRVVAWLLSSAVGLSGVACGGGQDPTPPPASPSMPPAATPTPASVRLTVAVNVWAVGSLTQMVAGPDLVELVELDSVGHEQPTAADLERLGTVDAVLFVGMSARTKEAVDRRWPKDSEARKRFSHLSEQTWAKLLKAPDQLDDQLPDGNDPHIWLDPAERAVSIVREIQRALAEAVSNDDRFKAQVRQLVDRLFDSSKRLEVELTTLAENAKRGLANCPARVIVPEHPAYQYLAAALGLEQLPITRPSGGQLDPVVAEAQERKLAQLSQRQGRLTMFLEESKGFGPDGKVDPERLFFHALAERHNATVKTLASLEAEPKSDGDSPLDYVGAMRRNIDSLRVGLGC